MPKSGRRRRRICPICGSYGSGPYLKTVWAVKSNGYRGPKEKYLYFAHRVKDLDGKWKVKWCYIPLGKLYGKEEAHKVIEIKETITPEAPASGAPSPEVHEEIHEEIHKETITPPAPEPEPAKEIHKEIMPAPEAKAAKGLIARLKRVFRRG